jgi:hypothetical protein
MGEFPISFVSPREKAVLRLLTAVLRRRSPGVAFFDFLHGQTGVAPNGIELHPVLDFACLSS